MSAADAERFDAVGEELVGAEADERHVGPVLVEPFPRVVDRAATPAVLPLVSIVRGLLRGEPRHAYLSRSDRPRGIASGLAGDEVVLVANDKTRLEELVCESGDIDGGAVQRPDRRRVR